VRAGTGVTARRFRHGSECRRSSAPRGWTRATSPGANGSGEDPGANIPEELSAGLEDEEFFTNEFKDALQQALQRNPGALGSSGSGAPTPPPRADAPATSQQPPSPPPTNEPISGSSSNIAAAESPPDTGSPSVTTEREGMYKVLQRLQEASEQDLQTLYRLRQEVDATLQRQSVCHRSLHVLAALISCFHIKLLFMLHEIQVQQERIRWLTRHLQQEDRCVLMLIPNSQRVPSLSRQISLFAQIRGGNADR